MYFVHRKRTIFATEFRDLTCQKLLTCLKTLRTGRVLNLVVVVLCDEADIKAKVGCLYGRSNILLRSSTFALSV